MPGKLSPLKVSFEINPFDLVGVSDETLLEVIAAIKHFSELARAKEVPEGHGTAK